MSEDKQNIIDLVCAVHGEISEKAAAVSTLMAAGRLEGFWSKADNVFYLLRKLTVEHFRREEILLEIIERDERLGPGQMEYFAEVRREHGEMLKSFEDIRRLGADYDKGDAGAIRGLAGKLSELTKFIFSHAEKEDKELFPFAREFLSDKQLSELQARISEL